ncbi:unnamed protein product [Echinostoma caproni]|uniref:Helicase ATP-binding domain-containing protein n=1 Tax=Echinostoma caproni TaxID=27848 RepID=A0A183B286_9TREM|nr:unnamed protein product [Echinostoma caproni]
MDFLIQGIPVNFPYKPYGCQLSIMNRVVEALESRRNCLLESPTGTGKTLSLLCASLAWVNKKLVDKETIEVDVGITVLTLMALPQTRSSGVCEFDLPRKKSDLVRTINKLDAGGPWDIEDLVTALTPVPSCPYYCSRKLAKTADIIFCPYNYLLDPINRSATTIELSGHIVILDEAHNIEDASRESASFKITDYQLMKTKEDLENLVKQNVENESCEQLISMIAAMLRVMQLTRSRLVHVGESAQPTQVWTGTEISGLMGTVGLGPEQVLVVERAYRKLSTVMNENSSEATNSRENSNAKPKLATSSLHLMQALFVVLGYMFRILLIVATEDGWHE